MEVVRATWWTLRALRRPYAQASILLQCSCIIEAEVTEGGEDKCLTLCTYKKPEFLIFNNIVLMKRSIEHMKKADESVGGADKMSLMGNEGIIQ